MLLKTWVGFSTSASTSAFRDEVLADRVSWAGTGVWRWLFRANAAVSTRLACLLLVVSSERVGDSAVLGNALPAEECSESEHM